MCELIKKIQSALDAGVIDEVAIHKLQDAAMKFIPELQKELAGHELTPGRYLLYKDPVHGFVAMLLVWGNGDCTPIHAHGTWGIEAVIQNHVRVTNYTYCEKNPKEIGSSVLPAGSVAYVLPPDADVHSVAQWGDRQAITLHIYGHELKENIVFKPGEGFKRCAVTCRALDLDLFDLAKSIIPSGNPRNFIMA